MASRMSAGSAMRPIPVVPQARRPAAGADGFELQLVGQNV